MPCPRPTSTRWAPGRQRQARNPTSSRNGPLCWVGFSQEPRQRVVRCPRPPKPRGPESPRTRAWAKSGSPGSQLRCLYRTCPAPSPCWQPPPVGPHPRTALLPCSLHDVRRGVPEPPPGPRRVLARPLRPGVAAVPDGPLRRSSVPTELSLAAMSQPRSATYASNASSLGTLGPKATPHEPSLCRSTATLASGHFP